MKVEYAKCDGCGARLGEGHKSRDATFEVRTWFAAREYDVCQECWRKMCAAVGLNPDLKSPVDA